MHLFESKKIATSLVVILLSLTCPVHAVGVTNVVLNKPARASTELGDDTADKAVDGIADSNDHRWRSDHQKPPPHWLEVDLEGQYVLQSAIVYTGTYTPDKTLAAMRDFKLQYWKSGSWVDIPGAWVVNNPAHNGVVPIYFDEFISTNKVRLYCRDSHDVARVLELQVFGYNVDSN